ncbi:MAG: YkgJ family cysteine cluster protein [Planctomycetaceae bacterium]
MVLHLPIIENCDNCGACCLQVTAPPFFINDERNEAVEKRVPEAEIRAITTLLFGTSTTDRRPCRWYDPETRGCRHYDQRPDDCRAFEINSSLCHHHRRQQGIKPI